MNLGELPIDSVLRRCVDPEPGDFSRACSVLWSMAVHGRVEAGIYLVGLLRYYAGDLEKLKVVVRYLGDFHHESAAAALLTEFRRVKSSNTTRAYLNEVLRALQRFPGELVEDGLRELAEDTAFTPRMRAKLRAAIDVLWH